MADDLLKDRILSIYKSGEGINEKIAELKTGFPDGEIIEKVESLYDEGQLSLKSDEGSGKEAFLSRSENQQEVDIFRPEALEYKE